jgi:signal transduction histidine kinase
MVEICDEGRGFSTEPESGEAQPASIGIGIQGMKERARQLGGELVIRSGPGETVIRATLPFS